MKPIHSGGKLLNSTSIKDRIKIIKEVPFFSSFSSEALYELAELMEDRVYYPNEVVVSQGEVVNSIYIVFQGRAEVIVEMIIDKQKFLCPVCTLDKNDSIGLSKEGFFSTTGIRAATVTALTELHTLYIELVPFYEFLKKYPLSDDKAQQISENLLYMNFIKHLEPFASLSAEAIQTLIKKIHKKTYIAGDIIFHQGDLGDVCYLIASGQIEIILCNVEGKERILATLNSSELFGEQAILTDAPRSATARALTDCILLSISRDELNQLFLDKEQVRKEIVGLMMERQRPIRNPHISIYKHHNADGELIITLKDTLHPNYYRLSVEGLFIWEKLDGEHSIQEITLDFFKEFKRFSPQSIYDLVIRLAHDGFVNIAKLKQTKDQQNLPYWVKISSSIRKIMEYRVPLTDPDKLLTQWYNNGVCYFFTWPAQILCFLLVLLGVAGFIKLGSSVPSLLGNIAHPVLLFFYFFVIDMFIVPLHELGHAFATKYFGKEVNQFGIGWFWIGPIAYTDTSDMWLSGKWPRVVVNFAGLYVNAILAGISILIAYFSGNPHVTIFFWLYALVSYYNMLANLNPTQELDGYYILMDVLDKPNLREAAIFWLIKDLPRSLKSPRQLFKHKAEIAYWVATVLFLLIITYSAYLFQVYIVQYLLPSSIPKEFSNALHWILPCIVIFLSSIGIIAQIKEKASHL